MKIINISLLLILVQFANCNFQQNLWDTLNPSDQIFQVVETFPVNGQEINPSYNPIVFFNKTLDESSITEDSIIVYDRNTDPMTRITGELIFDDNDPKSITFIPHVPFPVGAYTLQVNPKLEDISNTPLESIFVIDFTVNSSIAISPKIKKIIPDISTLVRSNSKFKVFFNMAMDASSYIFTITQEDVPLKFVSHQWITDDYGDGIIFKFEPVSPNEFDAGVVINVILENFSSASTPSIILDPNPYIFAFNVKE